MKIDFRVNLKKVLIFLAIALSFFSLGTFLSIKHMNVVLDRIKEREQATWQFMAMEHDYLGIGARKCLVKNDVRTCAAVMEFGRIMIFQYIKENYFGEIIEGDTLFIKQSPLNKILD